MEFKTGRELSRFCKKLRQAGSVREHWWEAVEYTGNPKQLTFELYLKEGLFSKFPLIWNDDLMPLKNIASFINHHPGCKKWKLHVRDQHMVTQMGDFMIVERCASRGGDAKELENIVTSFGGDQEDVNRILNVTEEKPMGYLPFYSQSEATALAEIVHVGATAPVSQEEHLKIVQFLKRVGEEQSILGS